jgi:hypothetical protein
MYPNYDLPSDLLTHAAPLLEPAASRSATTPPATEITA